MCDHAEEQEMESEAMMAIFDTAFEVLQEQPYKWSVSIYPETGDPVELDALNHVACKLLATLPVDYPESVPELQVEIIKGLAPDHQETLTQLAVEEALANEGAACIFAVVERLREWLAENNVTGLDDISMHAQMMRKQKDAVKADIKAQAAFESQKEIEKFSEAELTELAVNKRRAEGTPCKLDAFNIWKRKFDEEMAVEGANQANAILEGQSKAAKAKKSKDDEKAGRLTGFQQFSDKMNNLEAIEAAAEQAELDETAMEELEDVNEELFDDDEDLDDLDFDDDESEEEEFLDI